MRKQTVPDLKELFKQAAEIAQQVPESMQEAAFNKAVDLLTGAAEVQVPPPTDRKKAKRPAGASSDATVVDTESAQSLLEQIDSTQHPGVRSSAKVLDRALMVLQIALAEHEVDGLGPTEIARVLTDKFRLNTTDAAVRMALGKATNLVNRVPRGKGYIYRIMGPGEEYLAHLGEGSREAASTKQPPAKRRRRKNAKKATDSPSHVTKKTDKEVPRGPKAQSQSSTKRKKSAGSLGPKAAIVALVESGFFASAKTGPEVQAYLRMKRGFDLGADQLLLAMLRLVRDGVLERNENEEGKYEYKQP